MRATDDRYGRNWAWMNNRIVPSEVAKGFGVGSKALGIEPLSAELARENDAWQVRSTDRWPLCKPGSR